MMVSGMALRQAQGERVWGMELLAPSLADNPQPAQAELVEARPQSCDFSGACA
jgi:hypothetical protein